MLRCMTAYSQQIILHANSKAEVFADRFCSHFNTMALPIIRKVEFNLKVIMYIASFVSEV